MFLALLVAVTRSHGNMDPSTKRMDPRRRQASMNVTATTSSTSAADGTSRTACRAIRSACLSKTRPKARPSPEQASRQSDSSEDLGSTLCSVRHDPFCRTQRDQRIKAGHDPSCVTSNGKTQSAQTSTTSARAATSRVESTAKDCSGMSSARQS
jgi:hypothetical protein